MTKQEWKDLLDELTSEVQNFEKRFNESNCRFELDPRAGDPANCVLSKCEFKYKNFTVFNNDFFNVYVDEWFHNYSEDRTWKAFPKGYKSGLQRVIGKFCDDHGLYCEMRKAYRDTVNRRANTCVFLVCLKA